MTKGELTTKHADLLKSKGSLLATADGQAFYNTKDGRNFANAHANATKSEVFELTYKAPKKTTKKESK